MTFECFKCGKEFADIKFIILHLKLNHFVKKDTVPMKCLVLGNVCTEEFFCFNKLKVHSKNCKPNLSSNAEMKFGLRQTNLETIIVENFHISDYVSEQFKYCV